MYMWADRFKATRRLRENGCMTVETVETVDSGQLGWGQQIELLLKLMENI